MTRRPDSKIWQSTGRRQRWKPSATSSDLSTRSSTAGSAGATSCAPWRRSAWRRCWCRPGGAGARRRQPADVFTWSRLRSPGHARGIHQEIRRLAELLDLGRRGRGRIQDARRLPSGHGHALLLQGHEVERSRLPEADRHLAARALERDHPDALQRSGHRDRRQAHVGAGLVGSHLGHVPHRPRARIRAGGQAHLGHSLGREILRPPLDDRQPDRRRDGRRDLFRRQGSVQHDGCRGREPQGADDQAAPLAALLHQRQHGLAAGAGERRAGRRRLLERHDPVPVEAGHPLHVHESRRKGR